MHYARLFQRVVHFSFHLFDDNTCGSGHRFKYGFVSDTTSTSIDLLGILVVSVDLDEKSTGPQNLKG